MASPQVRIIERDQSGFATTSSNTVLMIVGYATKGPIGKVVETISRSEFQKKLGPPTKDAPWSHLAAYRAFNQGDQVKFLRVANDDAVAAERAIINASPATSGYQEFSRESLVSFGEFTDREVYEFRLSVDGGDERSIHVVAPNSGDWTLTSLAEQINTQITSEVFASQEFEANENPTISSSDSEYRFKVSVDGDNLAETGDSQDEFSIFVDPGVSLNETAEKIKEALEAGTHGYQRINMNYEIEDLDSAAGLAESDYQVSINVDGEGEETITLFGITTTTTWNQLANQLEEEINSTFDADVRVVYDEYEGNTFLRVQSNTAGSGSTVVVEAAVEEDLIAAIDNATGETSDIETAVDGKNGTTADGVYEVSVNDYTNRVRISSLNNEDVDAVDTSVSIEESSIGGDDKSLAYLLKDEDRFPNGDGILEMLNGGPSQDANAELNDDTNRIRITTNSTGSVDSSIAITEKTGADTEDLIELLDGTEDAVDGQDEVLASETDNILIKAKEKGTATEKMTVVKSSSEDPVDGHTVHNITILYDEDDVEDFEDVSLEEDSDDFFARLINRDPDNGGSSLLEIEYADNDGDGEINFPDGEYHLGYDDSDDAKEYEEGDELGDYTFRKGHDGVPEDGGSGLFADALASDGELANFEKFDFHLLITPDNNSQTTQDTALQLAESRRDFLYIADPPFGLDYREVADWHNGSGHGRTSAFNTSWAATYWPWAKDRNPAEDEQIWCPPSVFIAEKFLEIDRDYGPWAAAAGETRGRLIVTEIETSPSLAKRDFIYGGRNRVNPIVDKSSRGIQVYGIRTFERSNSALRNVNIRRMVIYASKLIRNAMQGMIFEPNNPDSWNRARRFIDSILEPIRQANGLDDYQTIINDQTTTPELIARNKMRAIVKLVPTGTIEIIEVRIGILNPGATIED